MELLIQRVIDGLANGSIYALLALAIVLIFISTGTLNLAQGAMGMFCAFVAWYVWDPAEGLGLPLLLAVVVALLVGVVGGAVLERVFVRPVEGLGTSHTPAIIVTLGLFVAIQALAGGLFTVDTVQMPSPFPEGTLVLGPVRVAYTTVGLIGATLGAGLLMYLLFQKTRLGLAMRAAVDNPESSQLAGVRRSHMLMLGWALSGGLGALAGILIAPTTLVNPAMLDNPLFLGFAAAALGGLTSPLGAVIGGVIMGLVESLAPAYVPFLSNQLALTAVFAVMIIVLLVKPSGLFGRAKAVRV